MKQYKMWIGGRWIDAESGKTYPVYNPATEEEIAQLPLEVVRQMLIKLSQPLEKLFQYGQKSHKRNAHKLP